MWTSAVDETAPVKPSAPSALADPGLASVRGLDGPGLINDGKGSPMSIKLTDTQLVMLSAAAQRHDRCLVAPAHLKGTAPQKAAGKLIAAGLVKEVKAKAGAPIWRRDVETGQTYALKLTAAGMKAIAVDKEDSAAETDASKSAAGDYNKASLRSFSLRGKGAGQAEMRSDSHRPNEQGPCVAETFFRVPRAGSKLDRVIGMLSSDEGATINDLTGATHWLPHTARAALTGLRNRGYEVRLDRGDRKNPSIYRIVTPLHDAGE